MIITCEKCATSYEIDDNAISATGRMVKCTSCYHVWRQFPEHTDFIKKATEVFEAAEQDETAFKKRIIGNVPVATAYAKTALSKTAILVFVIFLITNICLGLLAYDILPFSKPLRLYSSKGIELQNIKFQKELSDDKVSLSVDGEIANVSSELRKMPNISIRFINKFGKSVFTYDYPIDKKFIKPGETIPFQPKISDIPAERVVKVFIDIGNGFELSTR